MNSASFKFYKYAAHETGRRYKAHAIKALAYKSYLRLKAEW